VHASRDLLPALADRGQLEQAVMNLVINARDAITGPGTIHVDVANATLDPVAASRFPDAAPGRYVLITVLDDGSGMPEDIRDEIFEPFFTTKERGAGTGLGLANVAEIIRGARGSIGVWSEPGAWTRFEILLPVAAEGPARSVGPDRPTSPTPRRTSTSETVLVVDDDDAVRLLATRSLDRAGFRILEARSGAEALEIASQEAEPIDLLVTDQNMPGMSGRELATRLLGSHPEVAVLVVSGDIDVAGEASTFSTLPKQFGPGALIEAAREALARKSSEGG
jgi:CheY-like chemotaxis protein